MAFTLRITLPRITHGAYVINLNDKKSKVTRWISFFLIQYISQEVSNKIKYKSIISKVFRK